MRLFCPILVLSAFGLWHVTDAEIVSGGNANRILQNEKLILTNVLFRHGDRMPLPLCPNDPMNNPRLWPKEWSQLSDLGVQQEYHLGQWLRQRYGALLSRTYKPSQIYVRSTDVDRTIASALATLSGLYPPLLTEMWNPDIRWQPIPVHTVPVADDYLMGIGYCPNFDDYYLDFLTKEGIIERSEPLFKYYTQQCGQLVDTLEELQYIYDRFDVEEIFNKPVPKWARPYYGTPEFEFLFYYGFVSKTYTPELARFKGGPLIKEMLTNMRNKVDGTLSPDRSMFMYSGHDTTISNVLNSLNMFDFKGVPPYPRPGYASAVLMELTLDEANNPYVSIVYRNDTNAKAQLLTIPNCGTKCPLDTMFNLYEDILPDDIVAECQL